MKAHQYQQFYPFFHAQKKESNPQISLSFTKIEPERKGLCCPSRESLSCINECVAIGWLASSTYFEYVSTLPLESLIVLSSQLSGGL
jgi:hypothetical protein